MQIWPPNYNLRYSKRARNVHLKVIPYQGLEVVLPARQKNFAIEELLNAKKSWIQKQLATLKVKPVTAVTELKLLAINQNWHIDYLTTTSTQIRSTIRPGEATHNLTVYGAVEDLDRVNQYLQKWLKQMASKYLIPKLESLSREHGLPFNKATVRAQQTLWGSCSYDKNISLNYKLLFLPEAYVTHLMLHELCHTKHLNHSKRFWDLLAKLDPNWQAHDRALRAGDQYVPDGIIV